MSPLTSDERMRLKATAEKAAQTAGGILRGNFGKKKEIGYKSRIDVVTNVDIESERAIIDIITADWPEHDIITEESDRKESGSDFRWIIDPLDGTVNYAHDYPFVSVSIACEVRGEIEVGIVYDPIREEHFSAVRGEGAFMNGNPVAVSGVAVLEKSLLATGFPYDVRENPYNNMDHFAHMIKQAQAVRRDGSAALNVCYTAMGRFDGYWELSINAWDIAAGTLILREAGGTVTGIDGGPYSIFDRRIVASNGRIHEEFLGHLQTVEAQVKS